LNRIVEEAVTGTETQQKSKEKGKDKMSDSIQKLQIRRELKMNCVSSFHLRSMG